MICADFAQFLHSFSTMRNFAQIFAITKIFAQEINFHQGQNFSAWYSGEDMKKKWQAKEKLSFFAIFAAVHKIYNRSGETKPTRETSGTRVHSHGN